MTSVTLFYNLLTLAIGWGGRGGGGALFIGCGGVGRFSVSYNNKDDDHYIFQILIDIISVGLVLLANNDIRRARVKVVHEGHAFSTLPLNASMV